MLVLSRKKSEELVIAVGGVEVKITVCEIRGDRVRLGVTAPQEVMIDRREVHQRKLTEPTH